jgi:hypothetical protein
MNTNQQDKVQKPRPVVPMFASMWVTLFLVLRYELQQPRPVAKND